MSNNDELVKIFNDLSNCINPVTGKPFDRFLYSNEALIDPLFKIMVMLREVRNKKINWDREEVFQALRSWRRDEASLREVAPYIVFHDTTLRAIAEIPILKKEDLLQISGIGPRKFDEYGDLIMDVLKPYTDAYLETFATSKMENEISPDDEIEVEVMEETTEEYLERLTCKECMLYRSEQCYGDFCICDDFQKAPNIDKEEMQRWNEIETPVRRFRRD